MRAPDFFLAGAPKSGTTSLWHWLGAHPRIHTSPIREPCFFAPEVADYTARSRAFNDADAASLRRWLDGPRTEPRNHGLVLDWDDYLSLFRDAGDAAAVGEASGNYLHSWNAPAAIRQRIPDARIVMILRNPVDRLFSHFASAVGAGEAGGTFRSWVDEQERLEADREPRFGPIWTGMYARHLSRWLASFPASQMHIAVYDDFEADPAAVLAGVLDFLGVEPHPIDVTVRHNVTRVPRWPVLHGAVRRAKPLVQATLPLAISDRIKRWYRGPARFRPSEADRARLLRAYEDDIRTLQHLLRRDLGAWLDART